jgi:hypothetical protein
VEVAPSFEILLHVALEILRVVAADRRPVLGDVDHFQPHAQGLERSRHELAGDLNVVQAAMVGAHIARVPFAVLVQLYRHPLTDVGIEKFLADARKIPPATG